MAERKDNRSLTGPTALVRQAMDASGAALPLREVVVTLDGALLGPVAH